MVSEVFAPWYHIPRMVNSSLSARQRTRAQTAAFLLGVRSELPDVDEGVNSRTVRHFYEGMDKEPSTTERHHAQLQKVSEVYPSQV